MKNKTKKTKPTSSYSAETLRYKPLRVVAPSSKSGRWSCIKSKTLKVTTREYYRLYMEMKRKAQAETTKASKSAPKPRKSSPKQSSRKGKGAKTTKPVQSTVKTEKKAPVAKSWTIWLKCSDDLEDWPKKVVKAFQAYLVPENVKSMTRAEHAQYLKFQYGDSGYGISGHGV